MASYATEWDKLLKQVFSDCLRDTLSQTLASESNLLGVLGMPTAQGMQDAFYAANHPAELDETDPWSG